MRLDLVKDKLTELQSISNVAVLGFLLLLFFSSNCRALATSSAAADYDAARHEFAKGHYTRARSMLVSSTDLPSLIMLCQTSLNSPFYCEMVERAVAAAPKNPSVMALLGLLKLKQGEETEGLKLLRSASKLDSRDEVVLESLAEGYDTLFDQANTEAAYNNLLAAYPQEARLWVLKGKFLERAGQAEKARECYSKGLLLEPHFDDAVYSRARSFFRQNRYKETVENCSACLKLHPDDVVTGECLRLRGSCYEALKLYAKSIPDYLEFIKTREKAGKVSYDVYNAAYMGLARNYSALKNYAEAEIYLTRLLKLNPGAAAALKLDAEIKEAKKDYRSAIQDYNRLLSTNGDNPEWVSAKARLQAKSLKQQ